MSDYYLTIAHKHVHNNVRKKAPPPESDGGAWILDVRYGATCSVVVALMDPNRVRLARDGALRGAVGTLAEIRREERKFDLLPALPGFRLAVVAVESIEVLRLLALQALVAAGVMDALLRAGDVPHVTALLVADDARRTTSSLSHLDFLHELSTLQNCGEYICILAV